MRDGSGVVAVAKEVSEGVAVATGSAGVEDGGTVAVWVGVLPGVEEAITGWTIPSA
jgi:hypothetical protein